MDENGLWLLYHMVTVSRHWYSFPASLLLLTAVTESPLLEPDEPLHVREALAHQILGDELAAEPVRQHLQERHLLAPSSTHCLRSLCRLVLLRAALVRASYLDVPYREFRELLLLRLDDHNLAALTPRRILLLGRRLLLFGLFLLDHLVHEGLASVRVLEAVLEALERGLPLPLWNCLIHAVAGHHVLDTVSEAIGRALLHEIFKLVGTDLLVAVTDRAVVLAGQVIEKLGGKDGGHARPLVRASR